MDSEEKNTQNRPEIEIIGPTGPDVVDSFRIGDAVFEIPAAGAPTEPETPVATVTPETPATPVVPATPEVPAAPVTPVTPAPTEEVPAIPVPETPVAPTEPVVPTTPVVPETPAAPTAPVTPVTPAPAEEVPAPAAPATPATPMRPGYIESTNTQRAANLAAGIDPDRDVLQASESAKAFEEAGFTPLQPGYIESTDTQRAANLAAGIDPNRDVLQASESAKAFMDAGFTPLEAGRMESTDTLEAMERGTGVIPDHDQYSAAYSAQHFMNSPKTPLEIELDRQDAIRRGEIPADAPAAPTDTVTPVTPAPATPETPVVPVTPAPAAPTSPEAPVTPAPVPAAPVAPETPAEPVVPVAPIPAPAAPAAPAAPEQPIPTHDPYIHPEDIATGPKETATGGPKARAENVGGLVAPVFLHIDGVEPEKKAPVAPAAPTAPETPAAPTAPSDDEEQILINPTPPMPKGGMPAPEGTPEELAEDEEKEKGPAVVPIPVPISDVPDDFVVDEPAEKGDILLAKIRRGEITKEEWMGLYEKEMLAAEEEKKKAAVVPVVPLAGDLTPGEGGTNGIDREEEKKEKLTPVVLFKRAKDSLVQKLKDHKKIVALVASLAIIAALARGCTSQNLMNGGPHIDPTPGPGVEDTLTNEDTVTPEDKTPGHTTPDDGKTPEDKTPGTTTPGDKTPDDGKTPEDKTPGQTTPGDKTPDDGKTPEDKTPGDKTPSDNTPGDKTPEDKTPGQTTPGDVTPPGPTTPDEGKKDEQLPPKEEPGFEIVQDQGDTEEFKLRTPDQYDAEYGDVLDEQGEKVETPTGEFVTTTTPSGDEVITDSMGDTFINGQYAGSVGTDGTVTLPDDTEAHLVNPAEDVTITQEEAKEEEVPPARVVESQQDAETVLPGALAAAQEYANTLGSGGPDGVESEYSPEEVAQAYVETLTEGTEDYTTTNTLGM